MTRDSRITPSQCAANHCRKKAQKGKTFCGGRVCNKTSTSWFKKGTHTNIAQAKRDFKDEKMRTAKQEPVFAKPFEDPYEDDNSDPWTAEDINAFYESRF